MTLRNGGRARSKSGGPGSGTGDPAGRRPVLDTGWSDYDPNRPADDTGAAKRKPEWADPPRNYRSSRSGGLGTVAQFAIFAVVAGALVLGGLFFVAKPIVSRDLANWAAENPTALKLPFMADIVRSELGTKLTQPVNAADSTNVAFQITADETPKQIADELVNAGLISDARAFVFESLVKGVSSTFISGRHVLNKSMTVDQIVAEARQLPREQQSELFDWLLAESFAQPDSEIDAAWRVETRRRIEEIQRGKVQGIPGEQVMGELRKIVGL